MQFEQFKSSLAGAAPPAEANLPAQALWWQAKGDWHRAHRCCQDSHDERGAWAHAYLHRVEGDFLAAVDDVGRPRVTLHVIGQHLDAEAFEEAVHIDAVGRSVQRSPRAAFSARY